MLYYVKIQKKATEGSMETGRVKTISLKTCSEIDCKVRFARQTSGKDHGVFP